MTIFSKSVCAASVLAVGFASVALADEASSIKDGRIGFVLSTAHWSVYQTADGKKECPEGLNPHGPREIFKTLYPEGGRMEDTVLVRQGLNAYPADHGAQFPYLETHGTTALGLNLDGKVGPKDFTSPDGEKGIDNAFYRVTGCNTGFRGPEGQVQLFANKFMQRLAFGRMMIELSGVEDLTNDPSVEVTIYRGLDQLLLDSTGENVAPGGSQRVDEKYGKKLIQHLRGKIEDGVLVTDPVAKGTWAWQIEPGIPRSLHVHDMRFRLNLTPTKASGYLAGYFDVDSLLHWTMGYATHHLAYDRLDAPEFYWAMRKVADAYPDATGANTALSSAISITMSQVFIQHSEEPAAKVAAQKSPTSASRTPAER